MNWPKSLALTWLENCFSSLQACLIADIVQHFVDAKLEFDASYVYQDVNHAIQHVHQSGLLHRSILSDPQKYLMKNVGNFNILVGHYFVRKTVPFQ